MKRCYQTTLTALLCIAFSKISFASLPTDYFRSVASGNWNLPSTWESSPDNITWTAATLTPSSVANTIYIRNGHTVTVNSMETADQLQIQNGGTLIHASGVFTITDALGDDVDIQSGGVFTLAAAGGPVLVISTINVATNAILRVSASGLTGAGSGVNSNNYIYQHQSILEYTLGGGFSTSNVVFFPNVNATTIPIFRVTLNSPSVMLVGSNNPTTFNGIFEISGTGTVRWQNSGDKIFRNGIRNTGIMDCNVSISTAKFIVNGITAELGGAGLLIVPPQGLQIGTNSYVTQSTPLKNIQGNIALLNNSYIDVASNELNLSAGIFTTAGSVTSHVITNNSGKLTIANVGTAAVAFPVGNDIISYNPVTITNTNTAANFSVNVKNVITPAIANPLAGAVLRTWTIGSLVSGSGVTLDFEFNNADLNTAFNVAATAEIGKFIATPAPGAWNIIDPARPVTGLGPYHVTTTAATSFQTGSNSFAIGNHGALLPLECIINGSVQHYNDAALLQWRVSNCDDVKYFEVERSGNNNRFEKIASVPVTDINTLQYYFTDTKPLNGKNSYRIKVVMQNGLYQYSNIMLLLVNSSAAYITQVLPNPVHTKATVHISSGQNTDASIQLYDATGKLINRQQLQLQKGTNSFLLDFTKLKAGIYFLQVVTKDGAINVVQMVKQ